MLACEKELVLISVTQKFRNYLLCIDKLCQILPSNLTGRISGNQFSKQFVY